MARVWALVVVLVLGMGGLGGAAHAQDADPGFSPASGHAHVIAQGVVALPQGDVVWRTVRPRAELVGNAPFEPRPLGFVLATAGPLLLADQTGEQTQLGVGEAALVRQDAVQQRSSLTAQPVSYLSIELVSVDAPPPPPGATVLQPGQPFQAPDGLHDIDLISDALQEDEVFLIPDSGAKNVVLITDGAATVGRPDGEPVVLLAGEAASFSGELQVGVAPDGGNAGTSFVVAMIGPEIAPPAVALQPAAAIESDAGEATPGATGEEGAISVQVFTCPPGMTAETLNAAACAPAGGDYDVTVSGAALASPLTLGDAATSDGTLTWSGLALGDYVIAEAVLPQGYTTYELAARVTSGNAETGYRVTLDTENPTLLVRIYNFAP